MKKMINPIEAIQQDISESKQCFGSLRVMSANDVIEKAKREPDPAPLYDEIIFENTMVAIFSDNGLGKSTFAVQIGEKIAMAHPVLYLDCELSDKQFEIRYRSSAGHHHIFPDKFYRVTIEKDNLLNENKILEDIKLASEGYDAKVLIIDNITYLCNNSEKGDLASVFMKKLKSLKIDGYTIIVIAHTPKLSPYRPINDCDMAGSRRLCDFFDSVIAIGRSRQNGDWRYIKQVKGNRTAKTKYDAEHVLVCELTMDEDALRLIPIMIDRERNHLKVITKMEANNMKESVIRMKDEGYSYREISREVGLSKSAVGRLINEG